MRFRARSERNRGGLRGFFVVGIAGAFLAGSCDKSGASSDAPPAPTPKPDAAQPARVDAAVPESAGASDTGSVTSPAVEEAPPALALPWQTPTPTLEDLALPATPVGTLSGVIFGEDRPVRAVVRAACGAGTVLQAVYENPKGQLRVTPGMAVRFFGLPSKTASYEDGDFAVTASFAHDEPQRLQGTLDIRYGEEVASKTYARLQVDAAPVRMLMEPRLDGDGNVPRYDHCLANGFVRVQEADGKVHHGYANAIDVPANGASILRVPLAENAGLQIVMARRDPKKPIAEPLQLTFAEARKPAVGQEAAIFVEAWWVPELAPPSEARGINTGTEKTVNVREGKAELRLTKIRGKWYLTLNLSEVSVPTLIDGPLHGKKLSMVQIAAWPVPVGDRPVLGDPPEWWKPQE